MNLQSLTPAERLLHLGKERVRYHSEHPETTRGGLGRRRPHWDDAAPKFPDYAALKYAVSTTTIRTYLGQYTALGADVLNAVIGTSFDRFVMFKTLALMPPEDRLAYIKKRAIRYHRRSDVVRSAKAV